MEELFYGNINKNYLPLLEIDNIFTQHIDKFSKTNYPDILESSTEIAEILSLNKETMSNNDVKTLEAFYRLWDENILDGFKHFFVEYKIPFDKEYIDYLRNIALNLGALIIKLKVLYNRPRPYQVAYYTKQPLYPFATLSGQTPSYPSGHACQIYFLCQVIANHYPKHRKHLEDLSKKVADVRVVMGSHYPTDNQFAVKIAKTLLEDKDIKLNFLTK